MKTRGYDKGKELLDGDRPKPSAPEPERKISNPISECLTSNEEFQGSQAILDLLQRDRLPEREPEFWTGLNTRIMSQVRRIPSVPERIPWYRQIWGTPFQWPGYAWVTALLLFILTPLAIYNIQYTGKTSSPDSEITLNEQRGELWFEALPSALEPLTVKESERLAKKVVTRLGKELSEEGVFVAEEELRWDVSPVLEGLNQKELDILIRKLQSGETVGSKKGESYVA
jgi:hypothetical protein